jgi:hypothetical protein
LGGIGCSSSTARSDRTAAISTAASRCSAATRRIARPTALFAPVMTILALTSALDSAEAYIRTHLLAQSATCNVLVDPPKIFTGQVVELRAVQLNRGVGASFGSVSCMNQATPMAARFGGWLVTGAQLSRYHRGNAIAALSGRSRTLTSTAGLFDSDSYLASTSDTAALLVFAYQGQTLNLLTSAASEARDGQSIFRRRARGPRLIHVASDSRRGQCRRRQLAVHQRSASRHGHPRLVGLCLTFRGRRTARLRRPFDAQARSHTTVDAVPVQLFDLFAGVRRLPPSAKGLIYAALADPVRRGTRCALSPRADARRASRGCRNPARHEARVAILFRRTGGVER